MTIIQIGFIIAIVVGLAWGALDILGPMIDEWVDQEEK